MQIRLVGWLVCWCLLFAGLPQVQGQAADTTEMSISVSGLGFFVDGEWGLVEARVSNRGEGVLEPRILAYSQQRPGLRFGTDLWIPSRSSARVFLPVRIAGSGDREAMSIEYVGRTVLGEIGDRQIYLADNLIQLLMRSDAFRSAAYIDAATGDAGLTASRELRADRGLERGVTVLSERGMPRVTEAWRGLDALLISRPNPNLDPAQLRSLRQWVLDGGHLWIMLDQVDPAWPVRLLGDDWNVTVVDRLRLGEVRIEHSASVHEMQFDYPVEFVRVIAPDMEVTHWVDGDPAALRKRVGRGQLLVTTVDARAWLVGEEASPVLQELSWFKAGGAEVDAPTQLNAFSAHMHQQIGYRIMSRGPVLAVLLLFCGVLLVSGLVLSRRGRLEWSGFLALGFGLAAAAVLMGVGMLHQRHVPRTIASGQVVEAVAGQPFARVERLVGIYSDRTSGAGDVALTTGGTLWPVDSQAGDVVLWSDYERWVYRNFDLRPGAVRTLRGREMVHLDEPMRARLRFTPDGVEGDVFASPFEALSDAVLATNSGRLLARMDAQTGRISAGVNDRAGEGQFVRATGVGGTLSERQISRQEVYREFSGHWDVSDGGRLIVWGQGLEPAIELPGESVVRNESLLVLPLEIERPSPGDALVVPWAFVTMSPWAMDGYSMTLAYDREAVEWIPATTEQAFLMHFALPEALSEVDVQSVTLRLDLRSPGRSWQVLALRDGEVQVLSSGQGATGRLELDLDGERLPSMTEGGVVLGLRIGAMVEGSPLNWEVRQFQVDLRGVSR